MIRQVSLFPKTRKFFINSMREFTRVMTAIKKLIHQWANKIKIMFIWHFKVSRVIHLHCYIHTSQHPLKCYKVVPPFCWQGKKYSVTVFLDKSDLFKKAVWRHNFLKVTTPSIGWHTSREHIWPRSMDGAHVDKLLKLILGHSLFKFHLWHSLSMWPKPNLITILHKSGILGKKLPKHPIHVIYLDASAIAPFEDISFLCLSFPFYGEKHSVSHNSLAVSNSNLFYLYHHHP